jgi:peptidoglycan/xylan/chitin deacetylase (PgdA/CDA1 family)
MTEAGDAVRRLVLGAARFSGLGPLLRRHVGGIGAILSLRSVTAAASGGIGVNRRHTIGPAYLDAAIAEMKRLGYRFVPLDDALERLKVGRKLPRFATITADIGYRDLLSEAVPVLERHEAPLTLYVSPGLASGASDLWWEVLDEVVAASPEIYLTTPEGRVPVDCSTPQRKIAGYRAVRDYLAAETAEEQRQQVLRDLAHLAGVDPARAGRERLMGWDELRAIAAHPLVAVGAHTVGYLNLRRLPDDKAWYEIVDAPRIIEMELGFKPRHMAFPYGDEAAVGPREIEFARAAGYLSAMTDRQSVLQPAHARNLHALPRLLLDGRQQSAAHLRAALSGVTTSYPANAPVQPA